MKKDLFNLSSENFKAENPKSYVVFPSLPDKLKPLLEIAYNLWWIWNSEAYELFRRIERDLWEDVNHNPIKLLGEINPERLKELESDTSFISHLHTIHEDMKRYLSMPTWYDNEFKDNKDCKIAYFSTEFGIYGGLPMYSGGLGVLSGDHLKSASDMGLPMVGVGLLYRHGYFKQYLNFDGWQQEEYIENHFTKMPIQRVKDESGKNIIISVTHPNGKVFAQIWKIQVGRIPLYLLDTDIPDNTPENREITSELYGGDREMRIRQETILGIGGVRALKKLGYEPSVIHLNEGHSAFLLLERISMLMKEQKLSFKQASQAVKASCVFTTHTPVPAGNEVFDLGLVDKYFSSYYKKIGITKEQFLSLGKINPQDKTENFCMTVLALKMSGFANGVSRLHGTISRDIWKDIWPGVPKSEIPITSITNGIHTGTWLSYEMAELFDRYIGHRWKDEPADQSMWQSVGKIPDAELWRSHERRRERLVSFARKRLKNQLLKRGAPQNQVNFADEVLDPEALTIGFARRFASYKRGNMIFRDIERLKSIINKKNMPIQIIIAGKAHPKDNIGKDVIKSIIHMIRELDLRHRVVFIEDYDMNVAHYLVQGVDIWLNNPRRPLEASGTSGMKAAANGVMNLSVLDGWWCEGYNGDNGWVIGSGEEYSDTDYQDEIESKAIYDLLENEIIPLFYDRGADGLPREWIKKMKTSMETICPAFNSNRMIEEYTKLCYNPAHFRSIGINANSYELAKSLSDKSEFLYKNWNEIKFISKEDNLSSDIELGNSFNVKAVLEIGEINPEDISVQIYHGQMDSKHRIFKPVINEMKLIEKTNDNKYVYEGVAEGDIVGHCGYVLRVLPKINGKVSYEQNMIKWM